MGPPSGLLKALAEVQKRLLGLGQPPAQILYARRQLVNDLVPPSALSLFTTA
jgi:hypothetical protein